MLNEHCYVVIMAGGRGTRFWPKSRRLKPKQLLSLVGDRTLLQATVDRLEPLVPADRTWVFTNQELRGEVASQLPQIPKRQIVAEPVPRNTAPCLTLAAKILLEQDPEAVLGVFPSDHLIARPARFRQFAKAAWKDAERGHLVVLGIQPRWPETGYGYIEFPDGVKPGSLKPLPVRRFREKPDLRTAKRFLASGRFFWNSGMFFWRADVFLDAVRRYLPHTAEICGSLPSFGSRKFYEELEKKFPEADNISVDYAVLEKAKNVTGLATDDIGWNDLGSWNAIYEVLPKGTDRNVFRTDALALDSRGNYVEAPGKLVALVGLEDVIVVDTPDALLVARRDRAQQVGDVVKMLERSGRTNLL